MRTINAASVVPPVTSPEREGVRTEQHDGTFAVIPVGVLDDECVEQVRAVISAAIGPEPVPVVIDLGDCVLQQRSALLRLMEIVGRVTVGGVPVALSCRRLTGRQLLQRVRPPSVPVFSSIGDAVQLHRFAELGYAPGWRGAAERDTAVA
jgi:hypothetical protein